MKSKFLALAAIVLLAAACSKSDELSAPSNFPADGVIRVTTNVTPPQTRAGWDNTENPLQSDFNIWITPQGESAGSPYIYKKKKMNYSKNSAWTAYEWTDSNNATPLTMLWKNSTTPVEVIAFFFQDAPVDSDDVTESFSNFIYIGQSNALSLEGADLLYFKGTVNPALSADATDAGDNVTQYALVDGKIRIPFRHINAKLDFTIKLGTEMNATPGTATNPITDIKVNGTIADFDMNLSTGIIAKRSEPGSQTPKSITPCHNAAAYTPGNGTAVSARARYECILIPQTVAANNFTVSFKIGDKEYEWKSTAEVNLESGKRYTLDLTVGKDLVTLGGFSASAWTEGTGGNTETE